MPNLTDSVIDKLAPYLGATAARASLSMFLDKQGLKPDALGPRHLPLVAQTLKPGLKVFIGAARAEAVAQGDRGARGGFAVRLANGFSIVAGFVIVAAAVVCAGAWHASEAATDFLALAKLAGLIASGAAGLAVALDLPHGEAQRRPWLVLGVGLLLYAAGQSVLAYHQVLLGIRAPFPSLGDPLFMLAALLMIAALLEFALLAFRSGLPLGTPFWFWLPALNVGVLFVVGIYPMLGPIVAADSPPMELALNIFYPVASFVTLAPLAVMQRIAIKFRGGRLLYVWLPITVGFSCVLASDVMFAYFSTLNLSSLDAVLDFFYLAGYWLIPTGILFQRDIQKR